MNDPYMAVEPKTWRTVVVRYGKMGHQCEARTDRDDLRRLDRVIVRTDRGRELGTVLTAPSTAKPSVPPDQLGEIVRPATPEDLKNAERVEKEQRPREVEAVKAGVRKYNLPMKVVDVDHLLGGERVIIYFLSEARVDFRELVRHLAHDFRTRIELKQIGARDQARVVGDIGHCGLDLCCRTHLKELGGITMDMAKVQKHTADPSKITGRCGKLLCCLRYEYVAYTEARKLLPAKGTRIFSQRGNGVVIDQNLLLREVTIFKEGTEDRVVVKLEEIAGAPKSAAGCNGCDEPAGGAAPTAAPAAAPVPVGTGEMKFRKVAKVSDIPEGKGRVMDVEGLAVAVYNVGGTIHATENRCPHAGGPIGEGPLDGPVVECPLHHWTFDVRSGDCRGRPGVRLKKFEVKVEGEDFYVRI